MTVCPKPSRERLGELFVSLARIPSPSWHERAMGDAVIEALRSMGLQVREDDTAIAIGGDCGNLICLVGSAAADPCIALGAHLDTVAPSGDIDPVLGADGVFTNSNNGILGADDKGAIAALLHATELLLQTGEPFPTFELFFTVCEENGLVGAKHLEAGSLLSPVAAVLDSSGPVGGIVTRAPSQKILHARFKGVAAHAGLEPELGRSAVQAAAKAVARMRLGRLDAETTANIGVMSGGTATNIVPESCEIAGECRGHDEGVLADVAASLVDAIHQGAAESGVDVEVDLVDQFRAFSLDADSRVVALASAAVSALGLEPAIQTAGGGSDANVLNERGVPTVNLSAGMMRVHSPDEYVPLDELERLCGLAVQLVIMAGQAGTASSDASVGA